MKNIYNYSGVPKESLDISGFSPLQKNKDLILFRHSMHIFLEPPSVTTFRSSLPISYNTCLL
jgi:hypothetical protein